MRYYSVTGSILLFAACSSINVSTPRQQPVKPAAAIAIDTFTEYYPDSTIMEKFTGFRKKDRSVVKHGKLEMWHENGKKMLECTYERGKKHGEYLSWYESGSKEIECRYVNDSLDGKAKWYYPGGEVEKEQHYKQGKLDGQCWLYYENGKIKSEGAYVMGVEEGVFREYFPNGDSKSIKEFSNGAIVRIETEFKKNQGAPAGRQ
jgi:antitoxin component YwqK of YwqJK toxin-antitoxin module